MSSTTRQLATRRKKQKNAGGRRAQLQPGDTLQDRYKVMGTLGVGGFSSVYQARDMRFPNVTRLCAIKEMIHISANSETRALARRSFETEASILATLEHPAVPDVFDYFFESERSYLVMEFIRGKDLEHTLEERTSPVSQDEVLDWMLQICEVLFYLHSHQPQPIVFRDLKPSNIMLDQHGNIRLIDFGIAKVFQGGAKGTMIGTEGYSPPEQYRGESSPAGDVYALGATMHHLLTMKDPRLEAPFSWHERKVRDYNNSVSPELEAVINRSLSYKATDRYKDAAALREALQAIRAGTAQLKPPSVFISSETQTASPASYAPSSTPPSPVVAPSASPAASPNFAPPTVTQQPADEGNVAPLWIFKCEDEIRSKPAVADKTVYVGAYDNNLYALNIQDGSFRWKYPATDGIGSAPFVYKNDVFIGSTDNKLYSINRHTGRLQWRFETQGSVYSSPRAEYDHVFFGSDDEHLYAVNAQNGRELWKSAAHSPVRSTPLVTEECVFFGTEGGYVYSLDLRSKLRWQFQAKRAITSSPTAAEDMLFVGSLDATVYALDINSGWAVWRARTTRPIISSPVVDNGIVFIGSSDNRMYAFDVFSGRQIWSYETGGQVASSPTVYNNVVYFGSTDGYIYSLDAKKGRLRWRYKTGGYVISSPTIDKDVLYIGSSDHHLYAISL